MDAEEYVLAFFQNDDGSGKGQVVLFNPNGYSVNYSVTTPRMTTGGLNVVDQVLTANNTVSVAVVGSLFLDVTGTDLNRGYY